MAQIAERSLRLRDSEGRVVKTSLGEMAETALYRQALKNTKGARADLFQRYHQEQLAAIDRPQRVRPNAEHRRLVEAIREAIDRPFEPLIGLFEQLERAGVIISVGGERFIAGWAASAAARAAMERIGQRGERHARD